MFNVCSNCGEYGEDNPVDAVDPNGPFVVCKHCHHKHPFLQLPLFIIGGVSGTGKSTISLQLTSKFTDCVVLDYDLLWRAEFNTPENDYYSFRSTWLEVAANISQSGRPVALFGIANPESYETLHARHYFSTVHYLLYTCSDEVLTQRLKARPEWRQSYTPEFIETMINFNRHLLNVAKTTSASVTVLDTGTISIQEASNYTKQWILQRKGGRE